MFINQNTRLLVVSPHPDDDALGVGGLIGKCIKEKAAVLIYYLCVGESRQLITGKTTSSVRLAEIKAVAKFTGVKTKVEYIGSEFCRLDTLPQKELIEKIEDIVALFKPSIAAIPPSTSYNQDHREVYTAAVAALRPTPRNIRHFCPTVLEYFEPYFWGATPAKSPNLYLDLTEKFGNGNLLDFKLNLYRQHKSQVRSGSFPRSSDNLVHLAYTYGKEMGIAVAEAYHLLRDEIC